MYDYVAARVYFFYDTTIDKVNALSYEKDFGFHFTDLIRTKNSRYFSIVDVVRFCVGNYTTQISADRAENLVDCTRRLVRCVLQSDTMDIVKIPPFEPNSLVGGFIRSKRNESPRLIVSSLSGNHPSTILLTGWRTSSSTDSDFPSTPQLPNPYMIFPIYQSDFA